MAIIKTDRSIIPACDVPAIEKLADIAKQTADIEKVGGYKVGFELALRYGLKELVKTVREYSDKAVIYDHQKAATDIPATGRKFCEACSESGVDAVIFFPQAGPETEKAWIGAAKEAGLSVIVGGEMTHPAYLEKEGGFIRDSAPQEMYSIAAELGVTDFVVPGNRAESIKAYRELLEGKGIKPVFYSPGLVAQGGRISESGEAAGSRWHAIVGRGIYTADDIRKAALELSGKL
jgi:orotidine-5'-phosphate decarboxylase